MISILVALAILAAGVGAIYLLLKNMSEDGVDIAAPGSCKRGRCGPTCAPAKAGEEAPMQIAEAGEQGRPNA